MILLFSVKLRLLPSSGIGSPLHYVMPILSNIHRKRRLLSAADPERHAGRPAPGVHKNRAGQGRV